MAAIAPTTIVAAMAELDAELAVLGERRQLLQQLLATWDDEHGETIEVEAAPAVPVEVVDFGRPVPHRSTGGGYTKWNYEEVAETINDATRRGVSVGRTLVERYGVTLANAQKMVKQARKLGYVPSGDQGSFVPTPIERTSFDAQAARDAAAGPTTGPVRSFGLGTSKSEPAASEPEPRYSVDDALAALEPAS